MMLSTLTLRMGKSFVIPDAVYESRCAVLAENVGVTGSWLPQMTSGRHKMRKAKLLPSEYAV